MSTRSPAAILFDVSGNLAVIQSGFPATGTVTGSAPGVMMAGTDGQFARLLKTAADGTLLVSASASTYTQGTQGVSGSVNVYTDGPQAVSGNVGITGPVKTYDTGIQAVSGTVTITATSSLPVHLDSQVQVSNFPAVQAVSGSVATYTQGPQLVSGTVAVSGSVAVYTQGPQAVSGTVNVGNWPPVVAVTGSQQSGSTFAGSPVVVGGVYTSGSYIKSLYVDVSGALYVTTSGSLPVTGAVQVLNQVTVTGSVLSLPSGIQQVSGSLAVDNVVRVTTTGSLPVHLDSQVSVNNFPATQNVSGSVSIYTQGPQLVSGTISVTGSVPVYTTSPQAVSGSVAVYTQGPQAVSGTVGVNNFPVVQAVSGSQLTGSTFAGSPEVVGGVFASVSGSIVKAVQTDVSGAVYVTTTGSLPVHVDGQLSINNFPATQRVSGSVSIFTQGAQAVTGSQLSGSTFAGSPVVVGGADTNNIVRGLLTTNSGVLVITGSIGLTDSAGRDVTVGAVPSGSTAQGNPLVVAGVDTSNVLGVGAIVRTVLVDSIGRIIIAPAGAGATPGYAFGDIALSAITSSIPVYRTTYNEPTASVQRSVVSTSTSDKPGGSGAAKVIIVYYDISGSGPFNEEVPLNGTVAANTTASMCYIEKMYVSFVGSNASNVGTISLKNLINGAGVTVASINAAENQTFLAHHYVPLGKTAYVTDTSVAVNGGAAIFFLKSKPINQTGSVELQITEVIRESAQAPTTPRVFGTALPVIGPARIRMYVTTEAGTALTYRGAFDFYDQ